MSGPDDELPGTQEHDPAGDRWARLSGAPARDRAADREVREAIAAEQSGEFDPDTGLFRPSTWS